MIFRCFLFLRKHESTKGRVEGRIFDHCKIHPYLSNIRSTLCQTFAWLKMGEAEDDSCKKGLQHITATHVNTKRKWGEQNASWHVISYANSTAFYQYTYNAFAALMPCKVWATLTAPYFSISVNIVEIHFVISLSMNYCTCKIYCYLKDFDLDWDKPSLITRI